MIRDRVYDAMTELLRDVGVPDIAEVAADQYRRTGRRAITSPAAMRAGAIRQHARLWTGR